MKIAIISRSDINDKVYWSGIIHTIYSKLKSNNSIEIIKIDNLNNALRKLFSLKREYLKYTKKVKFDESYNQLVSKNFAKQIKLKLNKFENIDFLLTFDSSLVAYLNVNIPIILWSDLLYSDYYDHYFKKYKISRESKKSIKVIEKKALNNCHKVFLSSKWALDKAKLKYKKLFHKFHLLHFGPNFKTIPKKNKIDKLVLKRSKKKLSLITLGVNWERKGLDKVISLNRILNNKGINSEATIIGVKNKKVKDKNIKIINFVNKNNILGEKKISKNLLKSHFHILFSNSEAYGISLIEANSMALPNVSLKVGGISQIVKKGVNGMLFEKNTDLKLVANYIIKYFKNFKKYTKLAKLSYAEYNKNFSYEKIIPKFLKIIKK